MTDILIVIVAGLLGLAFVVRMGYLGSIKDKKEMKRLNIKHGKKV